MYYFFSCPYIYIYIHIKHKYIYMYTNTYIHLITDIHKTHMYMFFCLSHLCCTHAAVGPKTCCVNEVHSETE